jgi:hypothetical protein
VLGAAESGISRGTHRTTTAQAQETLQLRGPALPRQGPQDETENQETLMEHHYYVHADFNGNTFRLSFSTWHALNENEASAIGRAMIANIPGALYEYTEKA